MKALGIAVGYQSLPPMVKVNIELLENCEIDEYESIYIEENYRESASEA